MERTKKDIARITAASRGQRGVDRAEHFASGQTLSSWRGIHTVRNDRRKEGARRACRGSRTREE